MSEETMDPMQELHDELMQDPQFREAFEDAQSLAQLRHGLVQLRRAMGLSQSDVADRMGVGQSTVSEFETSANDPRISTLQRYARSVCGRLKLDVQLPAESAWNAPTVERWAQRRTEAKAPSSAMQSTKAPTLSVEGLGRAADWRAAYSKRSDFALTA